MTEELRGEGVTGNENRVARVMRREGIRAKGRRRFRLTTDSQHAHPVAPNVLARQFAVATIADRDRMWASDITYVPTGANPFPAITCNASENLMQWLRIRLGLIGLGFMSILAAGPQAATAQQELQLTVRPHDMATGTRTDSAGQYHLADSVLEGSPLLEHPPTLYVPPKCVGTRRCPLVVSLSRFEFPYVKQWNFELADEYGMLVLSMYVEGYLADHPTAASVRPLAVALQWALKRFAIDPEKIALIAGESGPFFLARNNLQVFSRIMALRPVIDADLVLPPANPSGAKGYYFVQGSFGTNGSPAAAFTVADTLLHEGNTALYGIALNQHVHRRLTYETAFQWFKESWANPQATPPPFFTDAAPMPLLTPEALAKLDAFWSEFMAKAPRSLLKVSDSNAPQWDDDSAGYHSYIRPVLLPVGQLQAAFSIADLPAIAAAYPEVAAILKATGLTAQEAAAYRAAYLSAWTTYVSHTAKEFYGSRDNSVAISPRTAADPTSVLGKNVALVQTLELGDSPDERFPRQRGLAWMVRMP